MLSVVLVFNSTLPIVTDFITHTLKRQQPTLPCIVAVLTFLWLLAENLEPQLKHWAILILSRQDVPKLLFLPALQQQNHVSVAGQRISLHLVRWLCQMRPPQGSTLSSQGLCGPGASLPPQQLHTLLPSLSPDWLTVHDKAALALKPGNNVPFGFI